MHALRSSGSNRKHSISCLVVWWHRLALQQQQQQKHSVEHRPPARVSVIMCAVFETRRKCYTPACTRPLQAGKQSTSCIESAAANFRIPRVDTRLHGVLDDHPRTGPPAVMQQSLQLPSPNRCSTAVNSRPLPVYFTGRSSYCKRAVCDVRTPV